MVLKNVNPNGENVVASNLKKVNLSFWSWKNWIQKQTSYVLILKNVLKKISSYCPPHWSWKFFWILVAAQMIKKKNRLGQHNFVQRSSEKQIISLRSKYIPSPPKKRFKKSQWKSTPWEHAQTSNCPPLGQWSFRG
jgi:hypothetical protein